jgi:ATP phosphoribosyltransferase regulatory subunit HisZ
MTEVDEDQVLEVIENKKFLAMRAATSSWPIPSTMEEQLKELADKGLIQDQGLAE